MSVIAYEYKEFEGVANALKEMPSLKDVVMNNTYVKKYNSKMPQQFKYTFENAVDRLLWYMYVANRVAYALQYQENIDIFTADEKAETYTPEKSAEKFSSFMYNIYTNSGNVFLSNDWLGLGEDIQKFLKKKFNMDFEAGGTLPTPFGQAGLVGETGAMNEMDLFAMGGDLPQGVHQFYAQTYNPAYPTPHGFAKGGMVDLFEDYKKMPDKLSKVVEKYQEKYEDGDMDYEDTRRFQKEVEALGYTFDFGLDNEPFGLRKKGVALSSLKGYEDIDGDDEYFAKGGKTKKRPKSALMRDRKYFNKSESWERQYSKGKNRKGYMAKGGSVKKKSNDGRGSIMQVAKEIRKDGEAWKDALKRAGQMLKDK